MRITNKVLTQLIVFARIQFLPEINFSVLLQAARTAENNRRRVPGFDPAFGQRQQQGRRFIAVQHDGLPQKQGSKRTR